MLSSEAIALLDSTGDGACLNTQLPERSTLGLAARRLARATQARKSGSWRVHRNARDEPWADLEEQQPVAATARRGF